VIFSSSRIVLSRALKSILSEAAKAGITAKVAASTIQKILIACIQISTSAIQRINLIGFSIFKKDLVVILKLVGILNLRLKLAIKGEPESWIVHRQIHPQ
jgi:hypothetical protein